MENKLKHLEFLQDIINRFSNNSFLLKGWTVVVISALFILASKDSNTNIAYLSFLPAIAFWILDGYYLRQERLYRKLFDRVRLLDIIEITFSMDISEFVNDIPSWFKTIFSKSLSIFHGTVIVAIMFIMFFLV